MSELKQYRAELTRLYDGGQAIARKHSYDLLDQQRPEFEEHLNAYKPELMFYGVYNSGKSTLLNAILSEQGEEIAPTADCPCTTAVQQYPFGDYTVWDTPGIDAPAEHERVSREKLRDCHVVCFVVSGAGQLDERRIAEALSEVLNAGRVLILVINDKQGNAQSEYVAGATDEAPRERLLHHLRELTSDTAVENRIHEITVNAEDALRGKAEQSPFWEHSGVPVLINLMNQKLAETSGTGLLVVPLGHLQESLKGLRTFLENKVDDSQEALENEAQNAIEEARMAYLDFMRADIPGLRRDLLAGIVRALENAESSEQVMTSINQSLAQYGESVSQLHERRYAEAFDLLGESVQSMADKYQVQLSAAARNVDLSEGGATPSGNILDRLDGQTLARIVQSEQSQNLVTEGLKTLRKLKVPGIKGRWERTLGRWAGRGTRVLGVAIQVAVMVWQWYRTEQRQKELEEQMRRRREEIHTEAASFARDVENDVLAQLPEISHESFDSMSSASEESAEEARKMQSELQEDIEKVRTLERQCESMGAGLRAN